MSDYRDVKVTLSLDGDSMTKAQTVAAEAPMVDAQLEALERSFERFQFKVGKRTWNRAELYDRS